MSAFKLTGIVNLPDFKRALLESPASPQGLGLITSGEAQRNGSLEVLTINQREGWVEVLDGGKKVTLKLEGSATKVAEGADSNLRLSNANLQQVLDAYATISGRTVLQHPELNAARISLDASARNREAATDVLEKAFQSYGIRVTPNEAKFVLVLPSHLTNAITARPGAIVPKTSENVMLTSGTIHFDTVDLSQALASYGRLIGRKFVKSDDLPAALIRLQTVNDLTQAEAAYALETLLLWNRVKVIPVGDTEFKAVPISPGNRR